MRVWDKALLDMSDLEIEVLEIKGFMFRAHEIWLCEMGIWEMSEQNMSVLYIS